MVVKSTSLSISEKLQAIKMRAYLGTLALLVLAVAMSAEVVPLPSLKINKDTVTVSGVSSGGAMAIQLHVAFSSIFKGVGAFAALPYYCAKGSLMNAVLCMNAPMLESVPYFTSVAKRYEEAGKIDSLSNLANSRVWLFAGTSDWTVQPKNTRNIEMFYEQFVKEGAINATYNVPANHAWITDDNSAGRCSALASPYINNCNFDGSGKLLNHLVFEPNKVSVQPRVAMKAENLIHFDQSPFGSDILDFGAIYVPTSCKDKNTTCHLHVALHGCDQNAEKIRDVFAIKTGLNEWAESNNVVVLYPQAKANFMAMNPKGCWDWWSYSNDLYATKEGVQMKAIADMIAKLSA
jgi:predicted peptidase